MTYQPIVKFENCYVAIATFKWWISNKTTLETRKCCTGDEWRVPESDQTWVTNKMTSLRNNKKLAYIDPFTITAVLNSSGTYVSGNNTLPVKGRRRTIKCIDGVTIFP